VLFGQAIFDLFSRSLWPVSLVDLNCIVSLPHVCTAISWSYFLAAVPLSPAAKSPRAREHSGVRSLNFFSASLISASLRVTAPLQVPFAAQSPVIFLSERSTVSPVNLKEPDSFSPGVSVSATPLPVPS
jgi:hypothetical protein